MSTIKLFRNCKILEEKNFQVDDIEQYLATLTSAKTFDNAQYIKMGLDAEVKVTLDQTYIDKQWTNMYNYCSIEMNNGGLDNTYYYFIRKMQWISKDAIKLILHLDVLNTYQGAYKLTDKTTINRMHKDRFVNRGPIVTEQGHWYLDDQSIFNWGNTSAGFEGAGDLPFPTLKGYTDVTFNVVFDMVTQPTYTYEWDSVEGILTLFVLAPTPGVIPQERVDIEATGDPNVKLDGKYVRNIDFQSEGLNPVLFKDKESEALGNSIGYAFPDHPETKYTYEDKNRYYLIYKASQDYDQSHPDDFIYNNAIDCYLASDEGFDAITGAYTDVTLSALTDTSKFWYVTLPSGADGKHLRNSFEENWPESTISETNLPDIKVQFYDSSNNLLGLTTLNMEPVGVHNRLRSRGLEIHWDVNQWKVNIVQLKRDNFEESIVKIVTNVAKIRFLNISQVKVFKTNIAGDGTNWYNRVTEHLGATYTATGDPSQEDANPVKPISQWDLTDQSLLKVIETPYRVDGATFSMKKILEDGEYVYKPTFTSEEWTWVDGNKSVKLETKNKGYFEANINFALDDEFYPFNDLLVAKPIGIILTQMLRDDKFESKLYHSDFNQYKLVYDSFSYTFNLENYDNNVVFYRTKFDSKWYLSGKLIKSVIPGSSMLVDLSLNSFIKTSMQDYDKVFVVNRNLEYPIWNNYYYNYLRNGYNYDVKNKQVSQATTGIGIGLSAASLAAGIALSATGYGAALGAGAIIGGLTGLAGSITNGIANASSADRALQQKLEQAKNQGASVNGADDLGLLDYYTNGNKMKIVHYGLSKNTKERIADLFYYCGYKCEYQAKPNTTSRYWFNFIQCDPVYDCDNTTAKISKDQQDELTRKYQEGVTVLHNHNSTWDFNQVKENWETRLIVIQ